MDEIGYFDGYKPDFHVDSFIKKPNNMLNQHLALNSFSSFANDFSFNDLNIDGIDNHLSFNALIFN